MYKIPRLDALEAPSETALAELRALNLAQPRSGAPWDPFRHLPEMRLSRQAQDELLAIWQEARARSAAADGRHSRARSDRGRNAAAREAVRMGQVASWAQETILASVSLLLVSRVELAMQRQAPHGADPDELMAEAITCAVSCMDSWSEGVVYHQYVAAAVDAELNKHSMGERFAGSAPASWQVAARHIPVLTAELQKSLGRTPSDKELGDALLERARSWAEARIIEKSGDVDPEVLPELVDAKLKKQGMWSAARNIGQIRSAVQPAVSLSEDPASVDPFLRTASSAEAVAEERSERSQLQRLLEELPGVDPSMDPPSGSLEPQREMLSSSLWRRLVLGDSPEFQEVSASRRTPRAADLVNVA